MQHKEDWRNFAHTKQHTHTHIFIVFTPVMVKILLAHCNIIINVPVRKECSAAGV